MRYHLLALAAAVGLACGQDTSRPKWVLGRWRSIDYLGSSFAFAGDGTGMVTLGKEQKEAAEIGDSLSFKWRIDYPAPDSAVLCIEFERYAMGGCLTVLLVVGDTLFTRYATDTFWRVDLREGAVLSPSHDARRYGCTTCTTTPRVSEVRLREAYMESMKSDLRKLVVVEETYFADHIRYTAEPSYLVSTAGVSRPDIHLSLDGYSATVTHEQLPGVVCAIFLGSVPRAPATAEGAPACGSLTPAERAADSVAEAAHARARAAQARAAVAEAERARRVELCVSKGRSLVDEAMETLRSVCTNNPDAWREWVVTP